MDTSDLLRRLTEASGVSGHEIEIRALCHSELATRSDTLREDALGNLIAHKRGTDNPAATLSNDRPAISTIDRPPANSVLIACHQDEIGLMVTHIEEGGFLRITGVGGWDPRVLLAQPVWVHATGGVPASVAPDSVAPASVASASVASNSMRLAGVVGSRPPHVLSPEARDAVIPMDELFIDLGLPESDVRSGVRVGDVISMRRQTAALAGGRWYGKSMDNRASVLAMIVALDELTRLRHSWDVYAVATVQEEVGLRGATTAAYGLRPTVAVAMDVTFAKQPGAGDLAFALGGGPVISFGPNFHPRMFDALVAMAERLELDHQVEPVAGESGTDAWAIQVAGVGVPTALLGIPVRYMHSTVETLVLRDIERTGRLLAHFIAGLDDAFADSLIEQPSAWATSAAAIDRDAETPSAAAIDRDTATPSAATIEHDAETPSNSEATP